MDTHIHQPLHLVHFFLEGSKHFVTSSECLLKLFKFLRVERELSSQFHLLFSQLLTALLLLEALCKQLEHTIITLTTGPELVPLSLPAASPAD